MSARRMLVLAGQGISDGVAIGSAVRIESGVGLYRLPLPDGEVQQEIERFRRAVEGAQAEIAATSARARSQLGEELAEIFEAHSLFLADRRFLGRIEERIREEKVNAEWAVHRIAEELGESFAGLDSTHLRERAEDLQDVSRYLLRSLQGLPHLEISEVEGGVVIVAQDLTPSEAVRLGRQHVVGFAIERGGPTSHTAIIARSLHLPLVAGLPGVTAQVTDEDPVVVDGSRGVVVLHPSAKTLQEYGSLRRRLEREERGLAATGALAAVTRDGAPIELMANIDLPEEIDEALRFGARGIGLYRSEFLYIEKSPELPTEEEHFAIYRRLVESMRPHPVVIRTYDLGGKRLARELMETEEDNPVLGLRGIRLTLARPHIFKVQVRALLRAGLFGDLWILLPLVSTVEEVRQFRAFLEDAMAELGEQGVPFRRSFKLGAMIEVPSAAMIADLLAREVDFFSIGTNDLIQYSLAVDRNNEHVAYLYRPLHPAILRMIRFVLDSARTAEIDVGICGEMAGDARCVPLLLGMGIRRLSVGAHRVPAIKTLIRRLHLGELEEVVAECLAQPTAADVEGLLARLGAGERPSPRRPRQGREHADAGA